MRIREIAEILQAEVVCGGNLDAEVQTACGSDMMSDVLAYVKNHSMLLTGLVNPQAVRTAEMLDMKCVAFVRGKRPSEAMIELAEENGIVLMTTGYRMFTACGKLYEAGLSGGCD